MLLEIFVPDEGICLDFDIHTQVVDDYPHPINGVYLISLYLTS